jgi:predicted acylesterase/phospholipase RssA
MSKKKIALVLSGGVSLGAYIAGALDELMRALSAASDRYEIDIITGASAGATTGALIAHGLLYRNGRPRLHETWVERLDITGLLARPKSTDQHLSLLNGTFIEDVALEALTWDSADGDGIPAPFCADELTLAMTIANTTALPYVSRVKQPSAATTEEFFQDRHAEQEAFQLTRELRPDNHERWQRISDVAQASSAFPFAFPRVRLLRRADDPLQYIHRPSFTGEKYFWYYDGGTYNNLPIDLAWHYIRKRGGDLNDRKVIVVSPSRATVKPLSTDRPYPNLLVQCSTLLQGIFNESRSIQFSREIAPPITQPQAGGLEELPGVDQAPVEILGNFALVIPQKGDSSLRGIYFHAFSAFLDRRFREYDFRRGAADARHVAMQNLGIDYDGKRPEGFYAPDEDREFQLSHDLAAYESLGHVPSYGDPNRSVKDVLEDALAERIDALLRAWNGPGWDFIIDPLLSAGARALLPQALPSVWGAVE